MTVSVEIFPFADTLDMYGNPDESVAYSLSGHVIITLSSSASFLNCGRPSRLLLSSLSVTFEGQSELTSEETGCAALRLCSISQECVPQEQGCFELTPETSEDSDKPSTWIFLFNLTIPGWLPATCSFAQTRAGDTGTRYGLHAVAKLKDATDGVSNSWLSAFCLPSWFSSQVATAPRVPIVLNRFITPSSPESTPTLFPLANYSVIAQPEESAAEDNAARIPPEVLSKLRVLVSIPESIGTEEDSIPLNLRLKAEELPESECKRLRVEEFVVDIEQTEKYRTEPLPEYCARFPVPPAHEQPPRKPLLDANPMHAIYDLGLSTGPPPRQVLTRAFSVIPDNISNRYVLKGDGYVFTGDADPSDSTWYSMSTTVPFAKARDLPEERDWKRKRILREACQTPFFSVHHRLHLSLKCTYDLTEGQNPGRATRHLTFQLPVRFVRTPSASPSPPTSGTPSPPSSPSSGFFSMLSSRSRRSSTSSNFPLPSLPYANTLPAYSQLFDSNGDRKIDFSIPLPVYTRAPGPDEKCQLSSVDDLPPQDVTA